MLVTALADKMIIDIMAGWNFSLALTSILIIIIIIIKILDQGHVYSWGRNSGGQLGLGHCFQKWVPHLIEHLLDKNLRRVVVGGLHCHAITREGSVISWGSNQYGQLGIGYQINHKSLPVFAAGMKGLRIVSIVAGARHSLALTGINNNNNDNNHDREMSSVCMG